MQILVSPFNINVGWMIFHFCFSSVYACGYIELGLVGRSCWCINKPRSSSFVWELRHLMYIVWLNCKSWENNSTCERSLPILWGKEIESCLVCKRGEVVRIEIGYFPLYSFKLSGFSVAYVNVAIGGVNHIWFVSFYCASLSPFILFSVASQDTHSFHCG